MSEKRLFQVSDLAHTARGFLMGTADVIPGVSGGTLALILGIYERLVTAVSRFDRRLLRHLQARQWKEALLHVDLPLLLPLGFGILLAAATVSSLMHFLLENHTSYTYAGLFGLILASSYLVVKMIREWKASTLVALAAGGVFAFFLAGSDTVNSPPDSYLYLFFCGAIAISAMILPGVSGSLILVALGRYEFVLGHVRLFVSNAKQLQFDAENIIVLTVFSSACIVGLLTFAKLLRTLLKSHWNTTVSLLCGFMIGSLRRLWPFEDGLPQSFDTSFWICIGLCIATATFVLILDRFSMQPQTDSPFPSN